MVRGKAEKVMKVLLSFFFFSREFSLVSVGIVFISFMMTFTNTSTLPISLISLVIFLFAVMTSGSKEW